jgi:prophage tail gpP-like protein
MTTSIGTSSLGASSVASALGQGGLLSKLQKDGRFPPISLLIKPLAAAGGSIADALGVSGVQINRFLSYSFASSILTPCDSFNFAFVAPDGPALDDVIKEGDLVVLMADDQTLATGILDTTETETDREFGEKGTLTGRDLMSQLEDQDAISMDSGTIWASKLSVEAGVRRLLDNTRITNISLNNAPSSSYLLATEPGESKLAALQRFLEPLNCIAWMGPDGTLNIGKPDMAQETSGRLVLNKARRQSNVLSMRATRASTSIPNVIVPIWAGQETTVDRVSKEQALMNGAAGPSRLFKLGHRVPKTVVVSTPQATDPQGLSSVNAITAGGGNLLQSYAKREMARRNVGELTVQAVVPGHFNESGDPYLVDTIYKIEYDRGNIDENMYLFHVEYTLSADAGQQTNLWFCRLGCIVADNAAPGFSAGGL